MCLLSMASLFRNHPVTHTLRCDSADKRKGPGAPPEEDRSRGPPALATKVWAGSHPMPPSFPFSALVGPMIPVASGDKLVLLNVLVKF